MSDEQTGRRAGLISKAIGTIVWGEILCLALYFGLPTDLPIGLTKPPLTTFLIIGLWWPLAWAFVSLGRFLLPMPFELLPRACGWVLYGPGHLLAYLLMGKDPAKSAKKGST